MHRSGAVEHRVEEWGGAVVGSILWHICLAAACYYGEALMFALLVGGTPSPEQTSDRAWHHHVQCMQVADVGRRLFLVDGGLNPLLVPAGMHAVLRVFRAGEETLEFYFTNRAALVKKIVVLRRGGDGVPRASGIFIETMARSLELAEAQVDGLSDLRSKWHLMPGAKGWQIVARSVGADCTDDVRLCGREGWFEGLMAKALGLAYPPPPSTPPVLQLAVDTTSWLPHLRSRSVAALSELMAAARISSSPESSLLLVAQLITHADERHFRIQHEIDTLIDGTLQACTSRS